MGGLFSPPHHAQGCGESGSQWGVRVTVGLWAGGGGEGEERAWGWGSCGHTLQPLKDWSLLLFCLGPLSPRASALFSRGEPEPQRGTTVRLGSHSRSDAEPEGWALPSFLPRWTASVGCESGGAARPCSPWGWCVLQSRGLVARSAVLSPPHVEGCLPPCF